jgi:hypothetical protein
LRIKQLYCGFSLHFREALIKKYGFNLVKDDLQPLFMFGCYNDQMLSYALNHKALVVICWAGTDAKMLADSSVGLKMDATPAKRIFSWAEILRGFPNIKHIAISKWIADDLESCGIPYFRVPVFTHNLEDYKPCPKGDSIYMYQANSPVYNGGIYHILKQRLPYNFIETTAHTFSRDELMDAYKKSFIGLRFTKHDGMNHTGCELGLLGRRSIYNGGTPYSIPFGNNIDEIVNMINMEYQYGVDEWEQVAKETKDYLSYGENFLNTEYYEMRL